MKQIYTDQANKCKLVKAKPETIDFLIKYSKSLDVCKHKGLVFERNLN